MTIEKEALEQAQEILDAMFQEQADRLEADWIAQGSPVDADGVKQYRGLAQIEAEMHEAGKL